MKSSENLATMRDEVHNYQLTRLTVQARFFLYFGLGAQSHWYPPSFVITPSNFGLEREEEQDGGHPWTPPLLYSIGT